MTDGDSQCDMDADCGSYQVCEIYCGNGWCAGICVDVDYAE